MQSYRSSRQLGSGIELTPALSSLGAGLVLAHVQRDGRYAVLNGGVAETPDAVKLKLFDDSLRTALLLCSDAGSFITGTNINVTGGGDLPWT